ncbi:unnamed protein product [Nippostrongylus brasiliensis]|uniref:Protein wntless homolog (inferred by orthology to a human protein) n=1 Tax=Nippostrongylus brasiliensis TaxID=27835 RepID=A0A158QXX3_NIPBR|nr:unnamed protein product [Nippostrongylus brasiliensis]
MPGTVVENLSNRKLLYILSFLLVMQILFFLVGAWYAPVPSSSMEYEMIKCKDHGGEADKWFHIRPRRCDIIGDLSSYVPSTFDLREIVFVAQMPHMRERVQLEYSPWFQFLLGLLQVEVEYSDIFQYVDGAVLELEVKMGYRTHNHAEDDWHDLIATNITRTLECTISDKKKSNGQMYDCGVIDLFEMGSNNYPFYLLNIRIPINQTACERNNRSPNCQIGKITNLRVVTIHQNGGFTLVWLWMKTAAFPVVLAAVWWYWNRIDKLARKPVLLEKAIMTLGVSLAVLDFPLEWVSLVFRVPFMLLLGDIRQGAFYGVLFAFWLIFAGEHLIDDSTRNNIASYRFNLLFIVVASSLLLVYDVCERGFQLSNPFYSIWSSEAGSVVAKLSVYVAMICTVVYILFLIGKIWKVWFTIKSKRSAQLYQNCENRRLKVEAIIYRFKFLMILTLLCAALTISCYIMKQYGEVQIHSDDPDESMLSHSTSAFFTGTFGMWNIYVLLLLAMYAPSHKSYAGAAELVDESEGLMDGAYESNSLTTFLKPATD